MQPNVEELPDDEAKKRERRRDERSPSADRPAQPGKTPSPEKPRSAPSLTESGGEPRQDPGGPRTTRETPENTDVESE